MVALLHIVLVFWLAVFPLVGAPPANNTLPAGFTVRLHPSGELQTGDVVSFEVFSPAGEDYQKNKLEVYRVIGEITQELGSTPFEGAAQGQFRAALTWAWDTRGLPAGNHTLLFKITPGQITWQQQVTLQMANPLDTFLYHWTSTEISCCVIHTITGTPAQRDLPKLLELIKQQASDASAKFGHTLSKKIEINLLPRILGQGGFAGEELYISYPEQNYTNTNLGMVLHHELVHRIDAETNHGARPTLFVEGLAVYLTGGHYKAEPILARAVALRNLGLDLPLTTLAVNFYDHQHEIGYIQAGALVDYMVRIWGWDQFIAFYRGIKSDATGSELKTIDTALRAVLGLSLVELDDRFTTFLLEQPVIPDMREDTRLTVAFYDSIRAYQQQFDPSAHFQQAWLPDAEQMRQRGIVGDYLRGPGQQANTDIEALLAAAGQHWRAGCFAQAWAVLDQLP